MVFKSSDWRMIMPQFLPLAEKKKPRPSYLNFFLFRVTLGRELCVLSPSTPRPDPAVCPKLSLTVPAGIASTTMEEAEESPGSPWDWVFRENKKKKAVLCLDTLRDSVHFSLQGYRSSPLSRLGLSSEGGWHSMSRLTLFLSNFPFFCLKEFLPNYCPATQGLNLLFPSLLLSQGAGQYLPHSDSTCFVLCSCAVACVEASHYFF